MRKYLNSSTPSNTDSKTPLANSAIPTPIQPTATSKPLNGQTCQIKLEPCTQATENPVPPNPTCSKPLVPTEATTQPLPSDPSGFRTPDSGTEIIHAQEIRVAPKDRKKRGWGGPGGKKRICLNAGRAKSKKTISEIMALHRKGYSNYRIGKELGMSHMTVAKYLTRGDDVPQARVEVLPLSSSNSVVEYEPRRSLQHTLVQIERMKNIYDKLLDDQAIPPVITPLNLLQLAQAERTILQVPGEIAKQQADLYDQIHGRALACTNNEVAELGQAGEMGS
jgi:predicted transcriptional regulator